MESEQSTDWVVTMDRNVFDRASFKRKQNARKSDNKHLKQKQFKNDAQQNCTINYEANEMVSNQFMDSGRALSNIKTQTQFLPGFPFNGGVPQQGHPRFPSMCSIDSSLCYEAFQTHHLDKLHFAQATRDAVLASKGEVNKKQQGSIKYSKWTQYMSSPSRQNPPGSEIDDGNYSCCPMLDIHTQKQNNMTKTKK